MALGLAVVLVIGVLVFNYFSGRQQGQSAQTESQKSQEQKEAETKLPTTHTVTTGETLWSISEKYYKSGYNWQDIQKANDLTDGDVIEAGQTLTIPSVPVIVPEGQITSGVTSEAAKPKEKSYTVVHGDNLWNIAVAQYANGYRWVDIAKANNLTNPGLIHAGNILTLPE